MIWSWSFSGAWKPIIVSYETQLFSGQGMENMSTAASKMRCQRGSIL